MNHPARRRLVFAASLLLAGTTAFSAPVDRFARTQEQINALFKRRLKPEPLPADLPNPFVLPGGAKGPDVKAPEGEGTTHPDKPPEGDLPPGSDAEALARLVAKLKISGIVQLNGRLHLIINQSPYKEGDLILLGTKDAATYLQVIRITPNELTLGLNQAVQTIKLKGG
jgi:hypothetical protein